MKISFKFYSDATTASQSKATKLYMLLYLWITIIDMISITRKEN